MFSQNSTQNTKALLWIQEEAIKPPFTIIVRDVDGPFCLAKEN